MDMTPQLKEAVRLLYDACNYIGHRESCPARVAYIDKTWGTCACGVTKTHEEIDAFITRCEREGLA
jgi:hypothetical protein